MSGEPEDMPAVKADQGGGAGLRPTDQEDIQRSPKPRDGFNQVGAGNQRPMNTLIPAQHIAGKIQQELPGQTAPSQAGN